MRNLVNLALAFGVFVMVGCTPARLVPPPTAQAEEQSEVIVYRESAFNAGGIRMIFGENERDYVELSNDEWARLYLQSGFTNLFVRSNQADVPYVLKTELVAGQKKCFKAYANPANYGKALLLGLAYYFDSTFLLEETVCPEDSELSGKVPTYYQKNTL